jgi:hypothetical protein
LALIFSILIVGTGCERKGLVSSKYPKDFYRIPKLLPDGPAQENPTFVIYGDSRPGWRVKEKFLKRKNWLTWKMVVIPFYEVYWVGNGISGGINYLRRTPHYGVEERRMVRDAIYEEAKSSGVDFVFHGGDMVTDGRRPSHWAKFVRENKMERPLATEFPLLPVIGNHEKANDPVHGLPNYKAIFEYPQFYVLDFPDVAVFVVDSDVVVDQYQFINDDEQDALFHQWFVSDEGSEPPAWLERELASRNQLFKIVVMHHPPISFARHHSDWLKPSYGRELKQKRKQFLSMLQQQEVQLILSCHDHLYEHSVVRVSTHEGPGIHVIVSGGGGVPLRSGSDAEKREKYQQNYVAEGLEVKLIRQEVIYHYCLLDIDADSITIRVMETTGNAKEPAKLAEEIIIRDDTAL